MRIALDARNIYRSNRRGTGKNLIDLYRELANLRPDWEFLMFYQTDSPDDPFEQFDNVRKIKIDIPGDRFNFWQQIGLPIAAKFAGADVLHCPANTAPFVSLVPMVVTIHDLNWFGRFASEQGKKWRRNIRHAANRADKIITPSEYTKAQIIKRFGVSTDNIIVNYWAPDRNCEYIADKNVIEKVKVKYGLPPDQKYVFGFGASSIRKNTAGVIDAWAKLSADVRIEYKLLLVGIDERGLSDFGSRLKRLGLERECILHSFASEADLPALMSGADVLCYASLSEGFGLPILDAFVCRTAVLTSNVTSMPEISADAAILVDPESSASIADGLSRLLTDKKLREELVRKGLERVKQFTWQACAERAASVFESVIN